MVLLARKDEEGNTQALYDHLHGAGRLASGFEDEFADISRTAAVLHDVGKVAQQFQTYLLSDDGHRGDVQHARQGAFVVNDFFESKGEIEEIAKEILELAISKHHGGLPDCIDESGNRAFLLGFTESDKSNEKYAYQEIKRGLNGLALDLQSNFRGSAEDIACFLKKIKSLRLSKDSIYFYLGLLVKLIYSRLVDADRTDAACFETRKQYRPNAVDWQNLISRLDKSMRSFDSSSEINRIRHQINEQCCLAGARETGIYRLSIPTGGGKTLASLNFALHHALKTGKRRIIYVIPYLSITTQTAKTFRDVLGLNSDSDVLLEHYSTAGMQRSADVADNASSEFEDAGEHQRKLAAERWDNPIIVTTMVEFLETVMSARGTKLRKFHNMADSVIIFDEIQSLPMNTINLFNEIVSFLSKITNSTILLCSATQPLLEKTKRENLLLSEKPDLIAETESYEDKLRRTRMRVNIDRLAEQSGKLSAALSKARKSLTIDELRGVEGLAAKDYFYAFDDLVLKNKDDFFFTSRSRRPPLDRLNALLSFCYSILTNDCIAALQGVGLDPYVGFMHTDRPGRASLALDLVEEFRPVLADRFVLTLVNTGAVKPGDFEIRENGGVLLSDFGRKKVLTAWQKKKSDQILHPFLQEKISWGLVPYVQALLLARSLRGDLDDYPPIAYHKKFLMPYIESNRRFAAYALSTILVPVGLPLPSRQERCGLKIYLAYVLPSQLQLSRILLGACERALILPTSAGEASPPPVLRRTCRCSIPHSARQSVLCLPHMAVLR